MWKRIALAVSILLSLVVGCEDRGTSGSTVGKGDVRQFILAQTLALGGRPAKTNDLPPLTAEWSFERNEFTTFISLPREQFKAVDVFLRHVFGPPSVEPIAHPSGNIFASYDTNTAGCGIIYSMSATNCGISLTKPVITSRDLPGFHQWAVHIGKGRYGIYGDSTRSAIVIVQGAIAVPLPFWGLVGLAAFAMLMVVVLLRLVVRRLVKAT